LAALTGGDGRAVQEVITAGGHASFVGLPGLALFER
jgi:hypothetical protein